MFKCECCSILIDSDEQPLKCPRCPNMENFSLIDAASEKLPLPDDDGLMTLVCSHCEDSVKVPDTTGTCPRCGKDSVFVNIPPVPLDPNLKPHEGAASNSNRHQKNFIPVSSKKLKTKLPNGRLSSILVTYW